MLSRPLYIQSTRMDFVTAVEAEVPFPIAFRNRSSLKNWAEENGLELKRIGQFDFEKSALIAQGHIPVWGLGAISYSQVWVRAEYKAYRSSLLKRIKHFENFSGEITNLDADHAVSKKRLRTIWPDAWVNLTLVDSSLNRAVGGMLEKDPLEISHSEDRLHANVEFLLKILCKKDGKMVRCNLQKYFDEASERFIQDVNNPMDMIYVNNANSFLDGLACQCKLINNRPTPKIAFGLDGSMRSF